MASRRIAPCGRKPDELVAEAVRNLVVGGLIDVIEQQRGVRDPRNQSSAYDGGLPGNTPARAMLANPLDDQIQRLVACLVAFRGPKMPQPAEPVQFARPLGAGRLQLER